MSIDNIGKNGRFGQLVSAENATHINCRRLTAYPDILAQIGIGLGTGVVHIGFGLVKFGIGIGIGLIQIGIGIGIVQIGIGRHDSRLQHIHYDHAVVGTQFLQLSKGDSRHLQLSSYFILENTIEYNVRQLFVLVFGVTLATQSSVDRLHLLIKVNSRTTSTITTI